MTSLFVTTGALILLFIEEIFATIFSVKNFQVLHDRSGLTRSAVFMMLFVVIHGIGNLHVYAGPDAFNGYAYFLNRPVPWGTLFLPVELYLLAAGVMHVIVAAVRTYKFKKFNMLFSKEERGQLWMAISGTVLLGFLVVHLCQFRFVRTFPVYSFRTKWMYPFYCEKNDSLCETVSFKDLYRMEFDLFQSIWWVIAYIIAVVFFVSHMQQGFSRVVQSHHKIERKYKWHAAFLGTVLSYFIGALYISYPVYCWCFPVNDWAAYAASQV